MEDVSNEVDAVGKGAEEAWGGLEGWAEDAGD